MQEMLSYEEEASEISDEFGIDEMLLIRKPTSLSSKVGNTEL